MWKFSLGGVSDGKMRLSEAPIHTYRGFFQICFNNLVVFEMSEGFSALIDTVSSKLSPTMADPEN